MRCCEVWIADDDALRGLSARTCATRSLAYVMVLASGEGLRGSRSTLQRKIIEEVFLELCDVAIET